MIHTTLFSDKNHVSEIYKYERCNTITWLNSMSFETWISRVNSFGWDFSSVALKTSVSVLGSGTSLTMKHAIEESRNT